MDLIIGKSDLNGTIKIPSSKSAAHRALISACLCETHCLLKGNFQGRDVEATAEILRQMGAIIHKTDCGLKIRPIDRKAGLNSEYDNKKDEFFVLDADESGSTLRFLLPVAAALGMRAEFIGRGKLTDRPIAQLTEALNERGADISGERLPLKVRGRLSAGTYRIEGGVSSQFISGLLFALPLLKGDSEIIISGEAVSAPYIELSRSVLGDFGIDSEKTENGFLVSGDGRFVSPREYETEGDWSSAAFLMIGGAIAGQVCVCGLRPDSVQGDKIVFDVLKQMGADISLSKDGAVIVKKSRLSPISYNAENCPDTVPAMCVAAAYAKGISEIKGVDRLKEKESDRLSACIDMLSRAGIVGQYRGGALIIEGGRPKSAVFPDYRDHRMAMSAAVMGLGAEGNSMIRGAQCIEKSYPDFVKDIINLGGSCREE